MPLISDVGLPGGGDPDGPRYQPNFRVLEYKPAAHRAAAIGLFASLALAIAFASRSIWGLVVLCAVALVVFSVLRWALTQEKGWAGMLGIGIFAVLGVLMVLSAVVSFVVLLRMEGASVAPAVANSLVWIVISICFFIFPRKWFSQK